MGGCRQKDYYPFGMVMEDRQYTSASYRYGFNGMEKDEEMKGVGNSYDFGARIFDPRLGRWLSLDPLSKDYLSLSGYVYVANNPIMYIDPDGRRIVIPDPADREMVLKMINSRARGVFGINDKGELYVITPEGNEGYSEYYRDGLIEAIKDEKTVNIHVQEGFDWPWTSKDGEKQVMQYPSLKPFGGGTTVGADDTNQEVYIDGKDYNMGDPERTSRVEDVDGNLMKREAADILMHELIGHAVLKVLGKSTDRNAVEEENKARSQLKPGRNTQRKADPAHKSCGRQCDQ